MADGVDAAVDRQQPRCLQPPLDRAPADPERRQLPPGHHAILPSGQLADPAIDGVSGDFFIHTLEKSPKT